MAKLTEEQLAARRAKKAEREAAAEAAAEAIAQVERRKHAIAQMRDIRPHKPYYTFQVGDQVCWRLRGHPQTVLEVFDDGLFYEVAFDFMDEEYGRPVRKVGTQFVHWFDVQPVATDEEVESRPVFSKFDETRLNFTQRQLDGLIHVYYKWRIDMSPVYQRGNVWTQTQKELLIESIFENRDIGKFVIIMRPFSNDRSAPHAEILDGKQRLTTLLEFYEGRFPYKGRTFDQLHWKDQLHFERYSIAWAEMNEKTTQRQKYEYFLKLNVAGMPQSVDHIQHVQTLLDLETSK